MPVDRCNTREKGQPLCMEQYYRLFNSYRRPGVEKDNLIALPPKPCGQGLSEHIIVLCKGQDFEVEVSRGGNRLREDDLFCQLRRISKMASSEEEKQQPIGILTSMKRDDWAFAWQHLMGSIFLFI